MKISIITSVYNNVETIEDALQSVLAQTYENIEYVVVDGGSSDGTLELLQKYKDNIDVLVSEPDKGIYDGLNKGVALATGDVVAFLHSDDLYADENIVANIVEKFQESDVDGVYGDLVYTPKDDTQKILRYWKSKDFEEGMLAQGWMPAHPTLFLKKSVYDEYGTFDLSFKIAGDYDFMLRVLSGGIRVAYLPTVFYKMRVGGESNKSLKNIIQKSKEDLRALQRNNVGGLQTLFIKNFSKLGQFVKKK